MPRLRKKIVVIEAIKNTVSGDYGSFGTMDSGDYFATDSAGTMQSISAADVSGKWDEVTNNTQLAGTFD